MPPIQDLFAQSDLVLIVGSHFTDYVNVDWKRSCPTQQVIIIAPDHVHVNNQRFSFVDMKQMLEELCLLVENKGNPHLNTFHAICRELCPESRFEDLNTELDLQYLSAELRLFTKETVNAILADVGNSWFIAQKLHLHENCQFFAQMQYGSIGWALGASLGVGIWRKHANHQGRLLTVIGDGAIQMSIQELSTIIRLGISVTIVLINNGSYAIEDKLGSGDWNTLMNWNYSDLIAVFGESTSNLHCVGLKATTRSEFKMALQSSTNFEGLCLIECIVDKEDCSPEMDIWTESMIANNT
jgi:pyruvate decarboxylase